MTKRFTGEFDKQYSGVHDNGEQLTNFEVVDLLNDLSEDNEYLEKRFKEEEWHYNHIDEDRDVWMHKCRELEKENEQLKHDASILVQANKDYRVENEQLKSTINTLTHDNTKMKKVLNTTKQENEHIKNTIKEAYETERTDLGKSVLKQLLNNIGGI